MAGLFGYLAAGAAEGVGTGIVAKAKALREERLAELERGFTLQRDEANRGFTSAENEKNRRFQLENRQGDLIDLGGGKYGVRQGSTVVPLVGPDNKPVNIDVKTGRWMTPEEKEAAGVDPKAAVWVGADGTPKAVGGGGVSVNVGPQGTDYGSPPANHAWARDEAGAVKLDDRGAPIALPVGPALAEQEAAAREAEGQQGVKAGTELGKAETMLDATSNIKKLMKDAGILGATGTTSKLPAMLSSTAAGKVRSYVGTLKSGVALGAIMRLKEASSTGATGFGAMNEKELQLLIDDVGALDPDTTDPEIFLKTIERIEDRFKRVVEDVKRNVSPERIKELGLEPLLASIDQADDLPEGVTEEDIQFTMEKYGLTRDEVLDRVSGR